MRLTLLFPPTVLLSVWACGGSDTESRPSDTPTSSAAPSATPDPVADFPELTPFSPELQATLHGIRAKVADIRGLPVHPTAQEGLVTRDALAAYGRDQFAALEDEDLAEVEIAEQMLTLMGLIPPGYTFEKFVEEESNIIAGVYYFEADRLVLVGQNTDSLSVSEELTIAHEYTHSLQDARYELTTFADKWTESSQEKEGYTSYSETLRCLIEGDAELTQRLYGEQVYGPDWQNIAAAESADDEPIDFDIPDFLLYGFAFYYSDCISFVEHLYEEGGWEAVNAAYDNPPGTTEQILDPAKFKAGEWATVPKPASLDGRLPGWSELEGGQWGQYDTYNYLGARTKDYGFTALLASFGWSSGWIRWFQNDSDRSRIAVEVRLAWDEEFGSSSFETAFADVLESHGVTESDVSKTGAVSRWVTSDGSNQHGALVLPEGGTTARLIFATDDAALDAFLSLE